MGRVLHRCATKTKVIRRASEMGWTALGGTGVPECRLSQS